MAPEAHQATIIRPTPKSVDRHRACRRACLQRFFEVWRRVTAQRVQRHRQVARTEGHLLVSSEAQFSGHLVLTSAEVIATLHGSFLCASLEVGSLRRALLYARELQQSMPRVMGQSRTTAQQISTTVAQEAHSAGDMEHSTATNMASLGPSEHHSAAAGSDSPPAQPQAAGRSAATQQRAASAKPRSMTMQLFLHCADINVSTKYCSGPCSV